MGARNGPNHGPIRAFSAIFACTGPNDGPVRALPLLPRKPRPGAIHPFAVFVVLGTIEVVEPLLFRPFHHESHQSPKEEGQYQQPEIASEQGYADADEHPSHVERVAHPGIDTIRVQAVVLDGVIDLVEEEGIAPDENAQEDDKDADDKHRSL